MGELVHGIDEALSVKSRDEWGKIFDENGFIWGPVLGLHEVAQDPQANSIGLFPTINHPDFGDYRSVHGPFRFRGLDVSPKSPAPGIGQHSVELLESAGYTDDEIRQLQSTGAVG